MKIRKVKIIDIDYKPLMKGIEISFGQSEGEVIYSSCLVGVNGSGKSQFLEIIAEIFLYLENIFRLEKVFKLIKRKNNEQSPFAFELEYEIYVNNEKHLVNFCQEKLKGKKKDIIISIKNSNGNEIEILEENIKCYLPNRIVGYTSGENETLSIPFKSYYDVYAEFTSQRAFKKLDKEFDYDPTLYFMDYGTNLGIVISNLIFEDEIENIGPIKQMLQINCLKRFQLTIQTKHTAAPNKGKGGVILTSELEDWKNKLILCSSFRDHDPLYDRYVLDFVINDATKEAFKEHFVTPLNLYTALYKLELLNNLIVEKRVREKVEIERKERKLVTKMPEVPDKDKVLHYSEIKLELESKKVVDYLSLSDGEHQYFNVFGTILMISQENVLFLLDEPETHFNPIWRRNFVSILKEISNNRKQDLFLTSHSPFIISDSKKEDVYIFNREDKDTIAISYPNNETYGASYDEILRMAFKIEVPISEDSLSLIKELEEEKDFTVIQEKIKMLGESLELMALHRRIELLKENQ